MATVMLGRVGRPVDVVSGVCVKTGRPTSQRVTVRGSTTPGWVNVLLVFTVIGWLFATAVSARRYQVTMSFDWTVHDRWRRFNRLSWAFGIGGVVATFVAANAQMHRPAMLLGVSLAGLAMGLANAYVNNVGVRLRGGDVLVLTRVHPAAAAAITLRRTPPAAVPRRSCPS